MEVDSENTQQKSVKEFGMDLKKEKKDVQQKSIKKIVFLSLISIWVLAGFSAFITSIICFGYSGSALQKMFGFLLAILLGPFYWFFYGVSKTYCS
jgi:fatty acid desaturase